MKANVIAKFFLDKKTPAIEGEGKFVLRVSKEHGGDETFN